MVQRIQLQSSQGVVLFESPASSVSFESASHYATFWYYLLVKNKPDLPPSRFALKRGTSPEQLGVDPASDEWLLNFTTHADQSMNGSKPWRGPREKSPGFLQLLITATTLPGDVVLDCTAMTGPSIHACRSVLRHFVALEADKSIFDALIAPLIRSPTPPAVSTPLLPPRSEDPDSMEIVPALFKKRRLQ